MAGPSPPSVFRFAGFELDVARYELRIDRHPIRLERRPMELLILLVERRGELVSRDEIVRRLWSEHAEIDVDMGINTAIRKVRRALNDRSGDRVFIETVSGKGYRFVADVSVVPLAVASARSKLAVLPFDCIGDARCEYLADGLDRGNDCRARPGPRSPHGGRTHVGHGVQGHDEAAEPDRCGARRRIPRRGIGPRRWTSSAGHCTAPRRRNAEPDLVRRLRQRPERHARRAVRARDGDCRGGPRSRATP